MGYTRRRLVIIAVAFYAALAAVVLVNRSLAGDNFSPAASQVPVTPGYNADAVVLSDSVDLTNYSRALFVGTGGDVTAIMRGGNTVTFKNVPDGSVIPIRVSRVLSTGTTAADVVDLY